MNDHTDDLSDRLRRSTGVEAPALSPELVTGAPHRRAPRLINHGRTARVASASMVAVAAVAVGSLIVTNPFAARAPLFTAAGAPTAEPAAGMMAEDARMMLWVDYDYVAGPGLSTAGSNAAVYELRRSGTAEGLLVDLAERFDVAGEVVKTSYFDPAWPSYIVGPEDGTASSVTVTWSGTGNWWYNNPTAYPEPECELVRYETENGVDEVEECTQPDIPVEQSLAPSESEARALATELFRSLGVAVEASDLRVVADAWQTTASLSLTVDGIATAIEYSVGWSALGEIAWASGHAIEVVERGSFDTVSPVEAVQRMEDGRWFGAGGPGHQGGMGVVAAQSGVARDLAGGTVEPGEPSEPAEPVEPAEEPVTEPTLEPLPEPTPERVTVTVDSAEATLLLMWDAQGNAWLVPGYAMRHPDGFWNTVVSLIEGVIVLPAPVEGAGYRAGDGAAEVRLTLDDEPTS